MTNINDKQIHKAVDILWKGGIVVYPTETVYGIGCNPSNREACERIQLYKKRSDFKPMLLLASSLSQVEDFIGKLTDVAQRLSEIFWPGPLTMVLKPVKKLPDHLLGLSGGVAVRVTSHTVAVSLTSKFGFPMTSTSANLTGESPILTYEDAVKTFGKCADIILKNTEILHGKPSTVIDLTTKHLALIREGSITLSRIKEEL
ncbi:L-threonylcarbamoyladenylate synthase [Candidatus Latescibacterota bacterium]